MLTNATRQMCLSVLFFVSIYGTFSYAAGFDCKSKKLSSIEIMVCSDANLSELDSELNRVFKDMLSESFDRDRQQLLKEQHQWVTGTRDKCNQGNHDPVFCLFEAYRSRNAELANDYKEARTERMLESELPELSRRSGMTPEEIKETLNDCDSSQFNMNRCSYLYSTDFDITMDSVLENKLKLLPPACRDKLQTAQEKWKKDSNDDCSRQADDEAMGGSMRPLLANICMEANIKFRTAQLKSIKSCDKLP